MDNQFNQSPPNKDSDSHRYDDIIHLPHHVSDPRRHPQMPTRKRAAQFSPFAALRGYMDLIREAERVTEERRELSEDMEEEINQKLQVLHQNIDLHPEISITYFIPDKKKAGGAYVTSSGPVKEIDIKKRILVMADETVIPLDEIFDFESGEGGLLAVWGG